MSSAELIVTKSVNEMSVEERLFVLGKFMAENRVSNIHMSRYGSGDSGDRAEIDLEMEKGCPEALTEEATSKFESLEQVVDLVFDSCEHRVDANYNDEGGEFIGDLILHRDKDLGPVLVSKGHFDMSYIEEDDSEISPDIPKEEILDYLKRNLREDKAVALHQALCSFDAEFSLSASGSGDEGSTVSFDEHKGVPEELKSLLIAGFDEMVDGGLFNDDGGRVSFTRKSDGSLESKKQYFYSETSPINSYYDAFKVGEHCLERLPDDYRLVEDLASEHEREIQEEDDTGDMPRLSQ